MAYSSQSSGSIVIKHNPGVAEGFIRCIYAYTVL